MGTVTPRSAVDGITHLWGIPPLNGGYVVRASDDVGAETGRVEYFHAAGGGEFS